MKPDTCTPMKHPRELLLGFLEDKLSPEEMVTLRDHIEHCNDCAGELEDLRRITAEFTRNKTIFCPEPWEIWEYVERGEDPQGTLEKHLALCPRCTEEAELCKSSAHEKAMPLQLWERRPRHLQPADPSLEPTLAGKMAALWERCCNALSLPTLAVATVTALLVIGLVYPYFRDRAGTPQIDRLALSSVKWHEHPDEPELMSPTDSFFQELSVRGQRAKNLPLETSPRHRLAVLIFAKEFKPPLNLERLDRLYEALEPPAALYRRFDMIGPDRIKEAVSSGKLKTESKAEILKALRQAIHLSKVIIVTISSSGETFDVESELIDVHSGHTVRAKAQKSVTHGQLPLRVRDALSLLD